jgi:hypothetical protein
VDNLLVYRRTLGTGKDPLSPEKQSERRHVTDEREEPLNKPPLKGDLAYGIGLGKDHG